MPTETVMEAPMAGMDSGTVSENVDEICEIEATVATGFEILAKEEIIEKFNVTEVTYNRGKVNFHLPVSSAKQILELSSIDNACVVVKHLDHFKFAENLDSVLVQFREIIPQIDWKLALRVWNEFFTFEHPISPEPVIGYQPPANRESIEGPISIQSTSQSADSKPDSNSKTELQEEEASPEAKRIKKTPTDPLLPAFRATCYRTGKHVFQSPQAAAAFGGEINNYFGWNVDMKKFDIEVILTIDRDHVYVSLGLTRESLHRRNIVKFGPTTLRPTIAYNMLRFCRIKETEVVCDPMCGGGSIPIEAAINWPKSVHLCGDNYDQAAPRTKDNIDAVNDRRRQLGLKDISAGVCRWDATNLPLKAESVDVFITDMPFGKRSGSKLSNWHLYPRILRDMARTCKRETGRACLLTQDKKCLLKSLVPLEGLWRRGPTIAINIGGLAAAVFLLHRTNRVYIPEEEFRQMLQEQREKQQTEHKSDIAADEQNKDETS